MRPKDQRVRVSDVRMFQRGFGGEGHNAGYYRCSITQGRRKDRLVSCESKKTRHATVLPNEEHR